MVILMRILERGIMMKEFALPRFYAIGLAGRIPMDRLQGVQDLPLHLATN